MCATFFPFMPSKPMTAQNSPSFERSEILIPILDDLEANDQTLFSRNIAPPILTRLASQGMSFSSSAAELVFQGFRDALTKRGDDILSAMRHVFKDAYIEDFVNLAEGLKGELIRRLGSASTLASSEFQRSSASIRSQITHPSMPSDM